MLNTTIFSRYPHFFTLTFNYFYLMKGRATLFPSEKTVKNFVHLIVFICNVFTHFFSEMSKVRPFHLNLKTLNFFLCSSLHLTQNFCNQCVYQSIGLTTHFVGFEISPYFREKYVLWYRFFFCRALYLQLSQVNFFNQNACLKETFTMICHNTYLPTGRF